MSKDLYLSNKIVVDLGMNCEKIDVCKKNIKLFWKEHKDDTECMHFSRFRYVNVINKDGASVIPQICGETTLLHVYHPMAEIVVHI
jgi:hypothetical protein